MGCASSSEKAVRCALRLWGAQDSGRRRAPHLQGSLGSVFLCLLRIESPYDVPTLFPAPPVGTHAHVLPLSQANA